jgi:hypothetical protein
LFCACSNPVNHDIQLAESTLVPTPLHRQGGALRRYMEEDSATKSEMTPFAGIWVELELVILSDVSQAQKTNVLCFLSHVESRLKIHNVT